MRALALIALLPSIALADIRFSDEGADAGIINLLNCVGSGIACARSGSTGTVTVQQATIADVDLYVSTTGNDSNACTASGASACLTIDGAIRKIPRPLQHRVRVFVGAGSFGAFSISGFTTNIGTQRTTAGILIDGALATSTTLATGTTSGTATSGTAGADDTFGTLVDSGQSWTTDDLRGRFVEVTGGLGAGQLSVICANTATTITVCGGLLLWAAPNNTSTYAIRDSATDINTCAATPPNASGAVGSSFNSAIRIQSNSAGSTITLRGLSISAACNFGVYAADAASLVLNRMQFVSGGGKMNIGSPFMIDNIASTFPSTSGVHISGGALASANTGVFGGVGTIMGPSTPRGVIRGSLFVNGNIGISMGPAIDVTIYGLKLVNVLSYGIALAGPVTTFAGLQIDCTTNAGNVGVSVGAFGAAASGQVLVDHITFNDCDIAVQASGPAAWAQLKTLTSTGGVVTWLDAKNGARGTFTSGSCSTLGATDIVLDITDMTETMSAVASAGQCITTLTNGTTVCRDP